MQTGMYAISEMASLFNVSRQTLIYYDKIGLFKPAVVNEKGYRFYSPTQIPLMRLIWHSFMVSPLERVNSP